MKNFIKGIIGGIGNILPGVSGSALMIILNIYEQCLFSISELTRFKNIKKNIMYLVPITIGIGIGTISFGNVIKYFIDKNEFLTTIVFLGLILGTIPSLINNANKKGFKYKYLIPFIISISISILFIITSTSSVQYTSINFIDGIILGIIYGLSTIIPGISGTVLFNILGFYDMYLEIVANPFSNIIYLFYLLIGFLIILVILSNLITYLFSKYYSYTYYFILGFVCVTTFKILRGIPNSNLEIFIGMILLVISSMSVYSIMKKYKM